MIRKALAQKPDSGYILDSLGWLHYKKEDYAQARIDLEKAVEMTPDDPIIMEHLADTYAKLGEVNRALQVYEKALKLNKDRENENKLREKIKRLKQQLIPSRTTSRRTTFYLRTGTGNRGSWFLASL
jgi:tetratricopeptide (TPR) repeat protein